MNQHSAVPPIACQREAGVFSPEIQMRHKEIWNEIVGNITGIDELDNGYAFIFPKVDALFQMLAEYVTYERHCCPFFHFSLELESTADIVRLRLTGGEDVKNFLTFELASGETPFNLNLTG
jgi:hypothetical protein